MKNKKKCRIKNCRMPYRAKGYCWHHYYQGWKKGKKCKIDGCQKLYFCAGYCGTHYHHLVTLQKIRGVCSKFGCLKPAITKSFCLAHHKQWKRGTLGKIKPRRSKYCIVNGCSRRHKALGYCILHYRRVRSTGATDKRVLQRELKCKGPNCSRMALRKELCDAHYRQQQRTGKLKEIRKEKEKCNFPGCSRPHRAGGYCDTHYHQQLEGKPPSEIKPRKNSPPR